MRYISSEKELIPFVSHQFLDKCLRVNMTNRTSLRLQNLHNHLGSPIP